MQKEIKKATLAIIHYGLVLSSGLERPVIIRI